MSQAKFDEIVRRLHVEKRKAGARGDDGTWGNMDKIYWLLLGLVNDLTIEVSNHQ